MKRHESLIAFSREHHLVLSLANRMMKHPQMDWLPEIIQITPSLLAHFDEEERQFADYWPQLAEVSLRGIFERQHCQLRQMLATASCHDAFDSLAHALRDHVRFEERILYPAFEDSGSMSR